MNTKPKQVSIKVNNKTFRFNLGSKRETLIGFLETLEGSQFVSFVARTVPEMIKRGNPFYGRVVKVSKCNGLVNSDWERAVDNYRKRNGIAAEPYHAKENWFEDDKGSLVRHKLDHGKKYLRFLPHRTKAIFLDITSGEEIPLSKLAPFLRGSRDVSKPLFRVYSVENIESFKARGIELS